MSSVLPEPEEAAPEEAAPEPLPEPLAAPLPEPLPEPRWGLGDVAATLGFTILLGTVFAVLADVLAPAGRAGAGRAWASVALLVVPWIALAGWPIVASVTKGNGPRRDYGLSLTWRQAGIGFLGGAGGLFVGSIVGAVQEALSGSKITSAVGDLAASTTAASAAAIVVLALLTAFGAPVVEELAFRGLTYGAVVKTGLPRGWSVVAVTVVFALFHFEPQRIAVLLVIGGSLGLVRMWTGSTAASMVAHMTVNIPGAIAILTLVHGR
jgi:membrane protease YdiL (CAAX protease family)